MRAQFDGSLPLRRVMPLSCLVEWERGVWRRLGVGGSGRLDLFSPPASLASWRPRPLRGQERGEDIGDTVGYSVHLDNKTSSSTRLLFCTTGPSPFPPFRHRSCRVVGAPRRAAAPHTSAGHFAGDGAAEGVLRVNCEEGGGAWASHRRVQEAGGGTVAHRVENVCARRRRHMAGRAGELVSAAAMPSGGLDARAVRAGASRERICRTADSIR